MQSWIYLLLAILLEVAGTTFMKTSGGFTRLGPSAAIFLCYGASLSFLTLALKTIEVSISYAIWSGLGTALITLIGTLAFKEALTPVKVVSILLIILGVVGLNLKGGAH